WLWLDREVAAVNFTGQRVEDLQVTTDFFPVHEPINTPVALLLGVTQTSLGRYIRSLYPTAKIEDVYDGAKPIPKLRYSLAMFEPGDLEARTGMHVTGTGKTAPPDSSTPADPFAPLSDQWRGVASIRWTGAVYWPTDHPATLHVESRQPVVVRLSDRPPLQAKENEPASNAVELPRGWQPLTIEETVTSQRDLSLQIEQGNTRRQLTRWDLRPESEPQGLLAVYARDGQPLLRAVEPQINSFAVEEIYAHHNKLGLAMPFVATWQGTLRIDDKGTYGFDATGSGPFAVQLDGDLLCEVTQVEQPEDPKACRAMRDLAPGKHAIEARFDSTRPAGNTRRIFQLYWTPPGGPRELVPPTQFAPPAAQNANAEPARKAR
ncbi:MAG TPA: PA14 domain-containing protein, partial [Candidatus Acidoferrales bacterium]|nr:PA14 domain-containing protein [Candidatus Acidoferrales bacterium]